MIHCNTLNVKLSNSQLDKSKSGIKNDSEVTLNLSSNVIGYSNDETSFPYKILLTNATVLNICKDFANGSSAIIKFLKAQLPKMIQWDQSIFNVMDKTIGPRLTFSAELVKNKCFSKALLQTENNLLNNKIIKSSSLLIGFRNNANKRWDKDTKKVIRSLENRGTFIKGSSNKSISQKGEFLKFFRPLMTASLLLMKNVLTPIVKSVLVPLGLTAAASATDASIQKIIFGSDTAHWYIEMNDIMKIGKSLEKAGLLTIVCWEIC